MAGGYIKIDIFEGGNGKSSLGLCQIICGPVSVGGHTTAES